MSATPSRGPLNPHARGLGAMSFERRVLLMAWAVATPALVAVGLLLWSRGGLGTLGAVGLLSTLLVTAILAARLQHQVVYPLYTLANLLEALRVRIADQLAGKAGSVGYRTSDRPDVRIVAGQTVLETRLGAWAAKIEEALA